MSSKLGPRLVSLALIGALVGQSIASAVPHEVAAGGSLKTAAQQTSTSASLHGVLSPDLQHMLTASLPGHKGAAVVPANLSVIVQFRGTAPELSRFNLLSTMHAPLFHTLLSQGATNVAPLPLINAVAANVPTAGLQALLDNPDVATIVSDGRVRIPTLSDQQVVQDQAAADQAAAALPYAGPIVHTPVTSEPEALSLTHADATQKQGYDGRGVRVAIIDSGIDVNQPDLKGVVATDAAGRPLRVDFTGTDLTDTLGHGTAVASTIVSQGTHVYTANNANLLQVYPKFPVKQTVRGFSRFTITGIAPAAKIMSAKIFDTRVYGEGGLNSWIVRAIQWAVQNKADIISESFGGTSFPSNGSDPISQADEAAVHAGIIVLAADGNSGPGTGTVGSPAVAPDVIGVGASTDYRSFAQSGFLAQYGKYESDNIAAFTSRGPTSDGRPRPDVVAPGAYDWALYPTNKSDEGAAPYYSYGLFGGTSLATPVAAAVAALTVDAYRRAHHGAHPSPAKIKNILMSTADDLGYPASDQGAGRLNALRAVAAATGQGASIDVYPNNLVSRTLPGAPLASSFTVTNTGTVPQHVRVTADDLATARQLNFSGRTLADLTIPYTFTVPAGIDKVTVAVNWRSTDQIVLADGVTKDDVALRIALYDPSGRFVNYNYNVGSGFASTYAAHPVPGRWIAVISENARHDTHQNAHFINEPYIGSVALQKNTPFGSVSPASAVLAPGAHRTFTVRSPASASPGTSLSTVRVRTSSGQVDSIPFASTAAIPLIDDQGAFHGSFTGPSASGFASEFKTYSFPVQPGTSNIAVSVRWPDVGYGIYALLLDPNGNVLDSAYNGLQSSLDPNAPPNLSQKILQLFWSNPQAGNWQIVLVDLNFAGTAAAEPFTGAVAVDQGLVSPTTLERTVKAGDRIKVNLKINNPGITTQEIFGYATTGAYGWIPLQAAAGPLGNGNAVITNTQVFTFNTSFVPPGTKSIMSYVASTTPSVPVDLVLEAGLGSQVVGTPGPVSIGGTTYQGSTALISAPELPIGSWDGVVTLRQPKDEHVTTTVVGTTLAYALIPHPWISFPTALNGNIVSGQPVSIAPQKNGILPVTIAVPRDTAGGSYTSQLFVYSMNGDQLAEIPLALNVIAAPPVGLATPVPQVNDVATSIYFPQGQTAAGSVESLDVLNMGAARADGMLILTQSDGQTVQSPFYIPAHAHLSVDVNHIVGNNQYVSVQAQSDAKVSFGRSILRSDGSGSYSTGTPSASQQWYFADGYTVESFHESIVVLNPGPTTAHVHLTMVPDATAGHRPDIHTYDTQVQGESRQTLDINALFPGKAVSIVLSSSTPVVAERVLYFGTNSQGVTSRLGATKPSTDLYFDAGNGAAGQQSHLALFNPGSRPATVQIVYTDPTGAMLGFKQDVVPPQQRVVYNLTQTLKASDIAAVMHSSQPIVAEKVTFFGNYRSSQIAGEDSFGISASSTQWTFPGGTSGFGYLEQIALTNRSAKTARIAGSFFDNKGKVVTRTFAVSPGARLVINVNRLTGVVRGPHGSQFVSQNGVPFYAEQHIVYNNGTAGLDSPGIPAVQTGPQP